MIYQLFGMFCEDRCDEKECKAVDEKLDEFIDDIIKEFPDD